MICGQSDNPAVMVWHLTLSDIPRGARLFDPSAVMESADSASKHAERRCVHGRLRGDDSGMGIGGAANEAA